MEVDDAAMLSSGSERNRGPTVGFLLSHVRSLSQGITDSNRVGPMHSEVGGDLRVPALNNQMWVVGYRQVSSHVRMVSLRAIFQQTVQGPLDVFDQGLKASSTAQAVTGSGQARQVAEMGRLHQALPQGTGGVALGVYSRLGPAGQLHRMEQWRSVYISSGSRKQTQ
ncbi:hypothetical protein NE237_009073 [Protea cynaroides]|uniref:Uncharacterized protein n=1 Tax=Protea cynaroides TaxID=273540 RepID=A0A9Q0KWR1_9MAGN|nr:hypothetical protein NE237_009073 [Protea cynaroides]